MKYAYTIYSRSIETHKYELFAIARSKEQAIRRAKRLNLHIEDKRDYYIVKRFNIENGGYPNEAETIII